jgi:hypothetical protein
MASVTRRIRRNIQRRQGLRRINKSSTKDAKLFSLDRSDKPKFWREAQKQK